MRRLFAAGIFALTVLPAFSGCGESKSGKKSGSKSEKPSDKPRQDTPRQPVYVDDANTIYGEWKGTSKDASTKHDFVFRPGFVSVKKKCFLGEGVKVEVMASGATFDDASQTSVTLAGGLFATASLDGMTCTIDFPSSMEFLVRNGKVFIRLQGEEKLTSLVKTLSR